MKDIDKDDLRWKDLTYIETKLVKTALLDRWEIANVGKDGIISKHIKEITPEQIYAIMIDGLKNQINKMPEGFTINIDGYIVDVVKEVE